MTIALLTFSTFESQLLQQTVSSMNRYGLGLHSLHLPMNTQEFGMKLKHQSSVLSFYVTYHYFIHLWESKYPTTANNRKCITETTYLSYDEENAIWYIGGYIIRKVRRKIKALDVKDDLLAMLEKFEEKEDTEEDESLTGDDDDEESVDTKKWITLIDRGGLVKCSNNFYSFLRSVELEIKDKISHDSNQFGKPNEIATVISGKPGIKEIWKFITEDEISPGSEQILQIKTRK